MTCPSYHYTMVAAAVKKKYGSACNPQPSLGGSSFGFYGSYAHVGYTHCPCGNKWVAVLSLRGFVVS